MSGIVGYVGRRNAAPLLLERLRLLEDRGYDSSGIAVRNGADVNVVRASGKLSRLEEALSISPLRGTSGIGHIRSTLPGQSSFGNAPYVLGDIALVHAGNIDNRKLLLTELSKLGARLNVETDAEIFAQLIERARRGGARSLITAVRMALRRVHGSYAVIIMARDSPNTLVVAKNHAPLIVGVGDGEMLCASDPSLLVQSREAIVLEDGDIAELKPTSVRLFSLSGHDVEHPPRRMDGGMMDNDKGGFAHYMLKEIHEQPAALDRTLRGRLDLDRGQVLAEGLGIPQTLGRAIDRVYFIGCGTSHHATIAGRYWLEKLARLPVVCELASETRDREPILGPGDLVVAVSQSGETADTLAAIQTVKRQGARVLSITNVRDSTIPKASDFACYTHAGPEIGVASTKCFTSQLAVLLMLAIHLGLERDVLSKGHARELLGSLAAIPDLIHHTLRHADKAAEAAEIVARARDVFYLGRGLGFPIALEGALKLKETSYLHAEGYAAGELRHGPIALIEDGMPIVVIAPRDSQHPRLMANAAEVRARGGRLITVGTEGDPETSGVGAFSLEIPATMEDVLPLLTVVPLQLLAYHTAVLRGTNVDQPRNLVKAITTE